MPRSWVPQGLTGTPATPSRRGPCARPGSCPRLPTPPSPAPALLALSPPSGSPGGWKLWSLWGECTRDCGGGLQTRTRTCLPAPGVEGGGCEGVLEEGRLCNRKACGRECAGGWQGGRGLRSGGARGQGLGGTSEGLEEAKWPCKRAGQGGKGRGDAGRVPGFGQ